MKFLTSLHATVLLMSCASVVSAAVYTPNMFDGGNHWTISAYDDSSDTHAKIADIGVCFFKDGVDGSELHYTWASDDYTGFGGRASQEGDQVKMVGGEVAAAPGYIDSLDLEIVTASPTNVATGHWKEWMPSNTGLNLPTNVVYATLSMVRDGPCPYATLSDVLNGAASPLRLQAPANSGPIGANSQ